MDAVGPYKRLWMFAEHLQLTSAQNTAVTYGHIEGGVVEETSHRLILTDISRDFYSAAETVEMIVRVLHCCSVKVPWV